MSTQYSDSTSNVSAKSVSSGYDTLRVMKAGGSMPMEIKMHSSKSDKFMNVHSFRTNIPAPIMVPVDLAGSTSNNEAPRQFATSLYKSSQYRASNENPSSSGSENMNKGSGGEYLLLSQTYKLPNVQ